MSENFNIPGKKNSFETPDGYFDFFSKRLMDKINADEELKGFKTLSSIPKRNEFLLPDAYFENFLPKLGVKMKQENEAKVFRIGSAIKKYRFAIAAVFALAIGSVVFFRMQQENNPAEKNCMELACLTPEEITNSSYFNQISLSDLESIAGQEIQDSLKADINKELINDLIQHPEELDIDDEDFEL